MTTRETNHELPRAEPRYRLNSGVDVRVLVQPHGSPEPVDAQLVDMSNSGLQLRLSTCLKFDESMAVHILAGELQFDLAASVKWIRQADNQSWCVGCRIKPELSEVALRRLASMGLLDRRESVRAEVQLSATISGELEASKTPAVIRNLSSDGFGLSTLVGRVVGQRIRVSVSKPRGATIDITARVIWQIKTNGGFFCGCAFLNRDSHKKLVALAAEDQLAPARGRVRSTRRTSLWIALAALVVFVFPSLVVVLMDENATQSASSHTSSEANATAAGVEEPVSSPEAELSTTGSDAATQDDHRTPGSGVHADAASIDSSNDSLNDSSASHGDDADATAHSIDDPSNADAASVAADTPIGVVPLASRTPLGATDDSVRSDAEANLSDGTSPDVTSLDANLPDVKELPPELIDGVGIWLGEAIHVAGELDRAARQASADLAAAAETQSPSTAQATTDDAGPPDRQTDAPGDAELADILQSSRDRSPPPAAVAADPADGFRTWTDRTGKHRVVARIEAVDDGAVRLLKENGRFATVPVDQLSKDDADYVRQWRESRSR